MGGEFEAAAAVGGVRCMGEGEASGVVVSGGVQAVETRVEEGCPSAGEQTGGRRGAMHVITSAPNRDDVWSTIYIYCTNKIASSSLVRAVGTLTDVLGFPDHARVGLRGWPGLARQKLLPTTIP